MARARTGFRLRGVEIHPDLGYPPARSSEYEDGHLEVWYREERVPWTDITGRVAPTLYGGALGAPGPPARPRSWVGGLLGGLDVIPEKGTLERAEDGDTLDER
jgi:hypothetical protein